MLLKRKLGTTDFTTSNTRPLSTGPTPLARSDLCIRACSPDRHSESQKQDPFVLVLIDGDNTLFRECYILEGAEGGHRAARDLASEIDAYLSQQSNGLRCKILLRIYWNLRGLSSTYVHMRSGTTHESLRAFTRAFNEERPLFESIDAGEDKEAADNKVKANFELYWHNSACQHIILAASGDRGYISFLRQYTSSDRVSTRLSLLEAKPFHPDYDWLRQKCRSFRSAVFSAVELQHVQTFYQPLTPASLSRQPSHASDSDHIEATQSAAGRLTEPRTERQLADHDATVGTTTVHTNTVSFDIPNAQKLHIYYNIASQRIDDAMQRLPLDRNEMRKRKLCNRFYLSQCHIVDCSKDHTAILDSYELCALRAFARLLPCRRPDCKDPCCVAGHQCLGLPACPGGPQCRFSRAMHHIDTRIVRCDTFDRQTLKLLASTSV